MSRKAARGDPDPLAQSPAFGKEASAMIRACVGRRWSVGARGGRCRLEDTAFQNYSAMGANPFPKCDGPSKPKARVLS